MRPSEEIKITLGEFNKSQDVVDTGKTGTHHKLACTFFSHIKYNVISAGIVGLLRYHLNIAEKAEIFNPALAAFHPGLVIGLSGIYQQFLPDYLVACPGIAADDDVANLDQLTLAYSIDHIDNMTGMRNNFIAYGRIEIAAVPVIGLNAFSIVFNRLQRRNPPFVQCYQPGNRTFRKLGYTFYFHTPDTIQRPLFNSDNPGLDFLFIIFLFCRHIIRNFDIQKAMIQVYPLHLLRYRHEFIFVVAFFEKPAERVEGRRLFQCLA